MLEKVEESLSKIDDEVARSETEIVIAQSRSENDADNFEQAAELAKQAISKVQAAVDGQVAAAAPPEEAIEPPEEDEVKENLKQAAELVMLGQSAGINVDVAKNHLAQAQQGFRDKNWQTANQSSLQSKQVFLQVLPDQLGSIISDAKPVLTKAKLNGADIRPLVSLLKEVNLALKSRDQMTALRKMKEYSDIIKGLPT